MTLRCLLWDFGDTLVDERIMWPTPPGVPNWTDAWLALDEPGGLLEPWCAGEESLAAVAASLAETLAMDPDDVVAHMRERCRHVVPNPRTWEFALTCSLPQAIVTVNPDIFSTDIVPAMKLDTLFSPVVTSWELGTNDKTAICDAALATLGHGRAEALLLDNKEANVAAWREAGGLGYHYEGDERFAEDLAAGRVHPELRPGGPDSASG